jgi:hypothetical protein
VAGFTDVRTVVKLMLVPAMNNVCVFFVSDLPSHPDIYIWFELGTTQITHIWCNLNIVNIFLTLLKNT